MRWDIERILSDVFPALPADERKAVGEQVFRHPLWLQLDAGLTDTDRALPDLASAADITREQMEGLYEKSIEHLYPIPEIIRVVKNLTEVPGGPRLTCLTNLHKRFWENLEPRFTFFSLFHRVYPSYRLKMIKPDPEIFTRVVDESGIPFSQTLFIDDTRENVRAASALGLHSLLCSHPRKCAAEISILYRFI